MDVGADRRSIVVGGGDRGEVGFRSAATPPAPDPRSLGEHVVAGYPNPVLFAATAMIGMIGMIALAGIAVRDSLILIELIQLALREGLALEEALVHAGAVRMRPVLLTAGTTLLGNLVITLDPVFSGLAWAIIFGVLASTVFTLAVVPAVYFLVYANRPGHGLLRRMPLE